MVITCLLDNFQHSSQIFLFFQIVFVGPFEHHSNLLPWKEVGAEVRRSVTEIQTFACN